MKSVSLLVKPASGSCNLRCEYCFYRDEMAHRAAGERGIMTMDTLRALWERVRDSEADQCTIAFQGGEPMLAGLPFFKVCAELAAEIAPKVKVSYAMQTNGTLLTEEWCAFLKEKSFLMGISLDGMKALHDAFRVDAKGEGTYDRVMEGIRLLEKWKIDYNILTVVNSRTAPRIRRIYENFKRQGFTYQQYIACLDPMDGPEGMDFSLTPKAYGIFMTELFDLWYDDLLKGQQPYIRQFENYIAILLGHMPEACEQRGICTVQNVVEADGTVYPCDFYVLDPYCMGNVNDPNHKLISDSEPDIARTAAENCGWEIRQELPEKCRACRYAVLCRNGCKRQRCSAASGEPQPAGVNRHCEAYLAFFNACYPRMAQIARRLGSAPRR